MTDTSRAVDTVRAHLVENGIEHEEIGGTSFSLSLPGEKKLQTPVRLDVGPHALGVHAFVCRNPDENHARVYRWLLERNLRMYAVSFAVDRHAGGRGRRRWTHHRGARRRERSAGRHP